MHLCKSNQVLTLFLLTVCDVIVKNVENKTSYSNTLAYSKM